MMINKLFITTFLLLVFFIGSNAETLKADETGHYLVDGNGKVVFLNGDTGWNLAIKVKRKDVQHYLNIRKEQEYNTIALAALFGDKIVNVYGDEPFEIRDGKPDPSMPVVTEGNDPAEDDQYDYWDHLDYVLNEIEKRDMYAVLVVCFNSWVVGGYAGDDRDKIVFDEKNAYQYGKWIGERYKLKNNLIWMLGGDRAAVYGKYDYRPVYNAMAEGIADGIKGQGTQDGEADYSGILMSFHPQKQNPNSSAWFHHAPWLTFNSIQACPHEQTDLIKFEYSLYPQKPTWLFEGRYENYSYDYKAWPMRYQAYLTVLAGGFGHICGHKNIWHFRDGWKESMHATGMKDMQHLYRLFTRHLGGYQLNDFIPDQNIIANEDFGDISSHCSKSVTMKAPYSDRIQAMISKDKKMALVYSSDGRDINLFKYRFEGYFKGGYWYNPRSGKWIVNGTGQVQKNPDIKTWPDDNTFDPPGDTKIDNDWVLVVEFQ